MRWYGAQPLRRQLFLGISLLLVPVLAAAIWSGWSTFQERALELGDQAALVAVTTSAYVDREVGQLDRIGAALAGNEAILGLDGTAAREILTRIAIGRSMMRGIRLAGADGVEIARAHLTREVVDADQAWAVETVKANKRVIGRIRSTGSPPAPYIVISYPVHDGDGRATGALGFYIDLTGIREALDAVTLPQNSVVTITDARGEVLAQSLDGAEYVGRKLGEGEPVQPRPPEARVSGVDGVQRMYAESRLARTPWLVTVGLPMSVAIARTQSLWLRNISILLAILTGWVVIATIMSRRLMKSVAHMAGNAQRIARGDFGPIEPRPMPTREFSELHDAFEQMLHRFNDTRAELDRHLGEERRIRQELQSLQRQVIRQERLAAVGQLVSGVAHEINNPLQAILGFAELLQMQADVPDSVKGDLRLIQKESARACGIIRNLAMFARQQPGEPSPVHLTDVIDAVVELRQRRLESEDIEVRVEDTAARAVSAVLTELQQVTLNFVVNAEQSILMSGRLPGRITLRTYDRNDYVVLEVEDTGPGIPPENEAKLFQPFFTTKPVGQGTGLGLSISYGIIDSLGGRIGYRNAPAGGAIFTFELPAVPPDAE